MQILRKDIGQTALPALLYLPGSQAFRLPIRFSAFAISLAAFGWYQVESTTQAPRSQMMLGPAPYHAYNPNRALYHFRWFWDTSGGQMTNLGQHALDIVHWCLGLEGPAITVDTGHGVRGMTERAQLLNGTLRAGQQAGSWSVEAAIPLEDSGP